MIQHHYGRAGCGESRTSGSGRGHGTPGDGYWWPTSPQFRALEAMAADKARVATKRAIAGRKPKLLHNMPEGSGAAGLPSQGP